MFYTVSSVLLSELSLPVSAAPPSVEMAIEKTLPNAKHIEIKPPKSSRKQFGTTVLDAPLVVYLEIRVDIIHDRHPNILEYQRKLTLRALTHSFGALYFIIIYTL